MRPHQGRSVRTWVSCGSHLGHRAPGRSFPGDLASPSKRQSSGPAIGSGVSLSRTNGPYSRLRKRGVASARPATARPLIPNEPPMVDADPAVRVGPIPDARIAKTDARKSLLWCLLISGSEMLMAAAPPLIGGPRVDACLATRASASAPRFLEHQREGRSRNRPP